MFVYVCVYNIWKNTLSIYYQERFHPISLFVANASVELKLDAIRGVDVDVG